MSKFKMAADASDNVEESVVLRFAQKLAVNEPRFRSGALKKLRRWLQRRSETISGGFSEDDLLKIWKGLHYCMWMADKPIFQENLAEEISSLIHCFQQPETAFRFISAFFRTEAREWFGIDRLRLDKFMTLIRRMLRHSLSLLKTHGWTQTHVVRLTALLRASVLNGTDTRLPDGLLFHLNYIYLDEIELVTGGKLRPDLVSLLVDPFCHLLAETNSKSVASDVRVRIFDRLIRNASRKASAGDESESDEDSSEGEDNEAMETDEKHSKKYLIADFKALTDKLFSLASAKTVNNRKLMYQLVSVMQDAACGKFADATERPSRIIDCDTTALESAAMGRLLKADTELQRAKKKRKRASEEEEEEWAMELDESMDDEDGDDDSDSDAELPKTLQKQTKKVKNSKNPSTADSNAVPCKKKLKLNETTSIKNGLDMKPSKRLHCEKVPAQNAVESNQSIKLKKLRKKLNGKTDKDEKTSTVRVQQEVNDNDCESNSKQNCCKQLNKKQTAEIKQMIMKMTDEGDNLFTGGFIDEADKQTSKNKKKKQIAKLNGSVTDKAGLLNNEQKKQKNKEENKTNVEATSKMEVDFSQLMDEIEIWVPNKKYKGPLKDVAARSAAKDAQFASFDSVKTPPAFVKHKTPCTDPKGKKNPVAASDQNSAPEKRVKFAMNKNQSQNFEDSLVLTPKPAFDPKLKPDQSILKPSPSITMKSPTGKLFGSGKKKKLLMKMAELL